MPNHLEQLPLCCLPLAMHVQEEVDKVLQRAHWDDESEMWVLERLSDTHPASALFPGSSGGAGGQQRAPFGVMPSSSRPYAVQGTRRPMSAFTKHALMSGDMNPRFRWARACVCSGSNHQVPPGVLSISGCCFADGV